MHFYASFLWSSYCAIVTENYAHHSTAPRYAVALDSTISNKPNLYMRIPCTALEVIYTFLSIPKTD